MKKSKSLKKQLLGDGTQRIKKKIAVLGGSTVDGIVDVLELFLLDYGIEPTFYKSEFGRYWQDAMFPPEELTELAPDLVFIHTNNRNISAYPEFSDGEAEVNAKLEGELERFSAMWRSISEKFRCPIIQNNFEMPFYRLLGNSEATDIHGRISFINRLNERFAEYARANESFYINDLNYVSACYGLDKWSDVKYWNMYKYALCVPAIPDFAWNLSHIIKAIFGKNKKALALDLDNTLWGGVVGDDGVEGIRIGQEVPAGQVYSEFQSYLKRHTDIGVLLTVCSKNEHENAIAGLKHPDGTLRPEDFAVIKANWDSKDLNISQTAAELSILPESIVFVDDNPAERAIVKAQLGIETPVMDEVENYIRTIDKNGYFEALRVSEDDLKRNEMYKANAQRAAVQASFADYGEYLDSLDMTAEIEGFTPMTIQRIAQLTNKSNQFNVTTKRYTAAEMEEISADERYIDLYGRLADKFGDNGIVSVVIGEKKGTELHIDLWLMSCRVLKRDMELAMLDELVKRAAEAGIKEIFGYYYPTAKNNMVRELFGVFGFEKISDSDGSTVWRLLTEGYENKNRHIKIK